MKGLKTIRGNASNTFVVASFVCFGVPTAGRGSSKAGA
jgi:hypothetical protein